ncbi:unnamed protein product [Closterium sp. NIES-64]|nr:unnamed protein product [Closterium sp. NIES-64]
MPTPPASADAAHNLFIASICRRWRRLAQRHVSTLLVKDNRVVSHRDVLNAVACFPQLTHLHLSDFSVETSDDAFLADLALSCPGLRALHVGWEYEGQHGRNGRVITELGLDFFFRHCSQLEQLSLCCLKEDLNPLASFFQLQHLRTLVLSTAFILKSPDLSSLSSLTAVSMETPDIHYNQLSPLLQLTNLTRLSLPDEINVISADPPTFSLAQLPLHSLKFGPWFGRPTALRSLSLAGSSILQLPEDLGGLTNLHTFHFEKNSLGQLLSPLAQLASLTRLELKGCKSELPDGMGEMTNLHELYIHHCYSRELPEGMGEMTNLQELYIHSCSYRKKLTEAVTSLGSLRVLRITECENLVSVPRRLDGLTSLTQLEVRGCWRLNEVPQALPLSLQALRFSDNQEMGSMPDVSSLTGLRELCLYTVDAACIEAIVEHLSNVQHLELELTAGAEESLSALTRLPRLRTLTLQGARSVNTLVECEGSGLQELRELTISSMRGVGLTELPAAITTLHHLTSIKINAEHLSSLSHFFGAFSRLRELDLSHWSSLVHLPASLTQLSCLHELNVSHTSIRLLPPGFAQLSRLRRLGVRGCEQLKALPNDISDLRMLERIDTTGCDMLRR